ncbi:MAG: aldo/keto reductase [Anderseniella sp.]|nr:aldo/keto reductase [Anderseniella sp.]
MKHVTLPGGDKIPALGLGTWRMGEDADLLQSEADVLRRGLDRGLKLIDTAEMYGEGGAELVVAQAVKQRRDEAYIVSKVYPHNASYDGVVAACERSLERLQTDRIDLYLLHWRGQYPLDETVSGFERLKADGKILKWGVSNLDAEDMDELLGVRDGRECVVDQVLYNLSDRGIEWDLKPKLAENSIAVMAYCPLGEGRLLRDASLATLADRHRCTPASIALAWLIAQHQTIAIPKTSRVERIDPIVAALEVELDDDDLALLDHEFPAPDGPSALSIV